jgi:xanthine dehydrogenase accessory factor
MEIFTHLMKWLREGKKTALATVISKQGSALRGVGSKMAVSSEMEMVGSVSGGCVEGAVVQEALKVMNSERFSIVEYDISDDEAWSVGLACGGHLKILIQPLKPNCKSGFSFEILKKIIEYKSIDKSFCLLTDISEMTEGDSVIIWDDDLVLPKTRPQWLDNSFTEDLRILERKETSAIIKHATREIFADFSYPKPRIVIIGAVHIAQSLIKMAHECGFTTIIIDPRRVFASSERFQQADQLLVTWPTEGLAKIGLNERDYLIVLSHDDKLDLPALQLAIERNVRYIGMLSSLKTRENRFEQLKGKGLSPEDFRRIHSPVGMDIGARSPQEIALSILAEITAFRYGKNK